MVRIVTIPSDDPPNDSHDGSLSLFYLIFLFLVLSVCPVRARRGGESDAPGSDASFAPHALGPREKRPGVLSALLLVRSFLVLSCEIFFVNH